MEIPRSRRDKTIFIFCIINAVGGLILGLLIYTVFRTDTHISKALSGLTGLKSLSLYMQDKDSILILLVRYYFCDFLWAYAFTFSVQIVIKAKNKKDYLKLSIFCLLFETLIEGMQKLNIISGTFDIYDILAEAAATLIAVLLINIIRGEKREKN